MLYAILIAGLERPLLAHSCHRNRYANRMHLDDRVSMNSFRLYDKEHLNIGLQKPTNGHGRLGLPNCAHSCTEPTEVKPWPIAANATRHSEKHNGVAATCHSQQTARRRFRVIT